MRLLWLLSLSLVLSTACNLGTRGRPPELMVNTPFVDRAGVALADPGRVDRTLQVTASGTIVRATAEAIVRHPRPTDLRVALTSPAGTEVELGGRLAEGNDYYRYAIPLLALQGESASGRWLLSITDSSAGQAGTIVVWALAFEALSPPPP